MSEGFLFGMRVIKIYFGWFLGAIIPPSFRMSESYSWLWRGGSSSSPFRRPGRSRSGRSMCLRRSRSAQAHAFSGGPGCLQLSSSLSLGLIYCGFYDSQSALAVKGTHARKVRAELTRGHPHQLLSLVRVVLISPVRRDLVQWCCCDYHGRKIVINTPGPFSF